MLLEQPFEEINTLEGTLHSFCFRLNYYLADSGSNPVDRNANEFVPSTTGSSSLAETAKLKRILSKKKLEQL